MANSVVVLGMHRSGTSAATRLVNLLGVPTPAEDDLLPHAFDNPRGHWESRSLVELNDRVLAARACDWTCPVRFEAGWVQEADVVALKPEAIATFRRTVTTVQWVWKDPRNCLLLPFWIDALGTTPVVVLVLRNPLEIAASLHARDHFEKTYCLALWERYMHVCLHAVAGLPATVTSYDEILDDPMAWCVRVRSFLASRGIEARDAADREVLSFIEPRLRHERVAESGLEPGLALSEPQSAVADALRSAVGIHDAFVPPALPPETRTTDELLAERRRALAAVRESMAASAT